MYTISTLLLPELHETLFYTQQTLVYECENISSQYLIVVINYSLIGL